MWACRFTRFLSLFLVLLGPIINNKIKNLEMKSRSNLNFDIFLIRYLLSLQPLIFLSLLPLHSFSSFGNASTSLIPASCSRPAASFFFFFYLQLHPHHLQPFALLPNDDRELIFPWKCIIFLG